MLAMCLCKRAHPHPLPCGTGLSSWVAPLHARPAVFPSRPLSNVRCRKATASKDMLA